MDKLINKWRNKWKKSPFYRNLSPTAAATKKRDKGRIRLKECAVIVGSGAATLIGVKVLYYGKIFGPSVHLSLKSGGVVLTQGCQDLRLWGLVGLIG